MNLKKLAVIVLGAALFCAPVIPAFAKSHGGYSHRSYQSKKASGPRKPSGHYVAGKSSSHKGGHYKNKATKDRYQSRH
jgi:hypothetical protein